MTDAGLPLTERDLGKYLTSLSLSLLYKRKLIAGRIKRGR